MFYLFLKLEAKSEDINKNDSSMQLPQTLHGAVAIQSIILTPFVVFILYFITNNTVFQHTYITGFVKSEIQYYDTSTVMGGIFTDDQMAAAMLDRLVHHGYLPIFEGKSYRMEHALMRRAAKIVPAERRENP